MSARLRNEHRKRQVHLLVHSVGKGHRNVPKVFYRRFARRESVFRGECGDLGLTESFSVSVISSGGAKRPPLSFRAKLPPGSGVEKSPLYESQPNLILCITLLITREKYPIWMISIMLLLDNLS